jgi:hypothetical protein
MFVAVSSVQSAWMLQIGCASSSVHLENTVSITQNFGVVSVAKCVPNTSHGCAHCNYLLILGVDQCSALGSVNVKTLPGD